MTAELALAVVVARVAAADAGSDLIVNPWAQLGATGGLVLLLVWAVRFLLADSSKQRDARIADLNARIGDLTGQRDRAYADLDELNRELRTNVMPTLAQVVRALERFVDAQARRQG